MASNPEVSVIMTVYNGERFVAEAIDSILQQTLRGIELVIVDDGSNDRTLDVVQSYEADDRVVVFPQSRIGRGRALNFAIEHSRGEFVAIMDADDLAEPDRLEKQLGYLREHPNVGALGGQKRLMYDGRIVDLKKPFPLTDRELRRVLPRRNTMVHISVMMPRSVLEAVDGYDECLPMAEDYDLWVRIAARFKLANLPDVLVIERVHQSAFFRNAAIWNRFLTVTKIRWQAWRQFSCNPLGLWFVVHPIESLQLVVKHKCPRLRHIYYVLMRHPSLVAAKSSFNHNGHPTNEHRAPVSAAEVRQPD